MPLPSHSHVRRASIAVLFILLTQWTWGFDTNKEPIIQLEPGGSRPVVNEPVVNFQLSDMFYTGKCDPCIARSEYRIQVITHGTENDVYWQQVQSAMQQASRDTGVEVAMELHDGFTLTEEDIYLKMASTIRKTVTTTTMANRPNALIVTLPSAVVHQAVTVALAAGMPVFGFHTGYQIAPALGVLGFVAQDETLAGQIVAQELLRLYQNDNDEDNPSYPSRGTASPEGHHGTTVVFNFEDNSTTAVTPSVSPINPQPTSSPNEQKRVVFIQSDLDDEIFPLRYQGLRDTLLQDPQGSVSQVDLLQVNPVDVFQTVQTLQDDVFLGCPYDMVVLGDCQKMNLVDIAVSAMVDLGCVGKTTLVSFGMSEEIVQAIVQGHIAFTAAPQHYIESAFAVVMASMFITTGKKLSLPKDNKMYLSGPVIFTSENLPTDSVQICREQAFPVCNMDGVAFDEMTTTSSTRQNEVCNGRGCLARDTIRIGGVLHGVTTDLFWDPVFAAARQAAVDVGVVLELERLEPQETYQILHAKMAARIRNLCESGVHGLFVTIPDDGVADAIRYCRSLKVPVISVNAGAERVEELDILQHIGQEEYNAGYGAGKKLVEGGMKEGYCLNHAPGNIVLDVRCRGFSAAIDEHPDVVYRGMVTVVDDNQAQYTLQVETAVAERSGEVPDTWDDIALLLGGAGQMAHGLHLLSLHPNAILGSFDVSDSMFEAFNQGKLSFGIDQQPFLQGSLPVLLLTYAAYTQEALTNTVIETGPRFVSEPPTVDEEQCESTFFSICSILPTEDMHFIDSWLLAIGYILVAVTVLTALVCLLWVVYYREKSMLVRISQPPFLITLCLGCIVSILSIVPMGVQTDYRYVKDEIATGLLTAEENPDINAVDAACMMVPWFYSVGFAMVFSSLFSRIWRVQMIFKAGASLRRRTVKAVDIAPYVAIMFVIVLSLLVAWQIADPFQWEREVSLEDIDGYAIESSGRCTSGRGWYFWLAILLFQIVCLFYALVLCFQTKHIQDDLSESSNTFLAVICIFQVNVIALPIAIMVYDDTEVFYFVRTCAVFLQNYTVLCLMFFPKMHRTYTGKDTLPSLSSLSVRASGSAYLNGAPNGVLRNSRVSFNLPSDLDSNANFAMPQCADGGGSRQLGNQESFDSNVGAGIRMETYAGGNPPPFDHPPTGNDAVYSFASPEAGGSRSPAEAGGTRSPTEPGASSLEPGSSYSPEPRAARRTLVEPGAPSLERAASLEPGAVPSPAEPGAMMPNPEGGEPGPMPTPDPAYLPFPIPGMIISEPGMSSREAISASHGKQNSEESTGSTSSPETDTATTADDDGCDEDGREGDNDGCDPIEREERADSSTCADDEGTTTSEQREEERAAGSTDEEGMVTSGQHEEEKAAALSADGDEATEASDQRQMEPSDEDTEVSGQREKESSYEDTEETPLSDAENND